MPLPGTRLIHPAWAEHHTPVAAGAMTATCEIRDPATATTSFDRATGQTLAVPGPAVYAGPCRVQALSRREQQVDAAGQDVTAPPYMVELLPDAAEVGEGWPVLVTACQDDPQLPGRTLTVKQVVYGTQRWTRVLFCDDE